MKRKRTASCNGAQNGLVFLFDKENETKSQSSCPPGLGQRGEKNYQNGGFCPDVTDFHVV